MSDNQHKIQCVSETAAWVAAYRAQESLRTDRLFNDPYAEKLAGKRGKELVVEIPAARERSWAIVVRTRVLDDLIIKAISKGKIDTVINLGAGLDTRPYRLALPSSLNWVEVDLPAIISHKEKVLANDKPVCKLERITCDLGKKDERAALYEQLKSVGTRWLVITEGLLVYLQPEAVRTMAQELHDLEQCQYWLFDSCTQSGVSLALQRYKSGFSNTQKPFTFGLPDDQGIHYFSQFGWQVAHESHLDEQARRYGRLPRLPWYSLERITALIKWVMCSAAQRKIMRTMYGYGLLQR